MRTYIFIDLDDTIFQTPRKCPEGATLHPGAYGRDGSPLSFMTGQQRALLEWFTRDHTVIPTTARNSGAFSRVAFPFTGRAILNFGGAILTEDGELDARWDARIRARVERVSPRLYDMQRTIEETAAREHLAIRTRVINDFDMDLYSVTKHDDIASDALRILYELTARHFADDDFYVHFNDNNLAIIPRCLNKRHAVQYLLDFWIRPRGEEFLTLGVGDSASDLEFMTLCDFCMTPGNSQIMRMIGEAHHV